MQFLTHLCLSFVLESLGSVPLAFVLPHQRPTDDLAEMQLSSTRWAFLVIQADSCKYSLGSFLPLLGRQEKEETGAWPAGLCGNLALVHTQGLPRLHFPWPPWTSLHSSARLSCQPHCLASVWYVLLKGILFPFQRM